MTTKPIVSARVEGSKSVMRALDRLSDAAAGKVLETALLAGALPIMNAAKQTAPFLTGSLRRSIHVGGFTAESPDYNPSGDLATHDVEYSDIKGNKSRKHDAEIHIGTNVEYGPPVEFGTATMPARPYLRPAFDGNLGKAKKEIEDVLKSQLRKIRTVR